jgi:hypothetical protein
MSVASDNFYVSIRKGRQRMSSMTRTLMAVALLCAAGAAHAVPVTYDFSVTATSGSLAGNTSNGYFTYDDSIVPTGGGFLSAADLLTDFSFIWNSTAYDESTVNSLFLQFAADGALTFGIFGSNCSGGTCRAGSARSDWFAVIQTINYFVYSTTSPNSSGLGTLTFERRTASVPEPGTLALLGIGLAGCVVSRRLTVRRV